MNKVIQRLLWEEDGQTLAEYGPIIFFIALFCIIILTLLGTKVRDAFFVRASTEIGTIQTSE